MNAKERFIIVTSRGNEPKGIYNAKSDYDKLRPTFQLSKLASRV